jgi:hypothetical protein
VLHLRLIIFSVGGDVPVDSDTLLMTDFVNLKIKPAQFFGGAHRGRIYVRVFIEVSACTYMNICVCTMFLKKYGLMRRVPFFLFMRTGYQLLSPFLFTRQLI